jgi:hypothetical protein
MTYLIKEDITDIKEIHGESFPMVGEFLREITDFPKHPPDPMH